MAYYFPVILGKDRSERVVMVKLSETRPANDEGLAPQVSQTSKQPDPNDSEIGYRVVITYGEADQPIIRIPKKVKLINSGEDYFRQQIDFVNAQTGLNSVAPFFTVEANGTPLKLVVDPDDSDSYYNYYYNSGRFDADIIFSFQSEIVYRGGLHVVRTESGRVMKINVDLGSDATQVTYYPTREGRPKTVNLIKAMMNAYQGQRDYKSLKDVFNPIMEPRFTQQEKGNANFYKTGNITFKSGGNIDCGIKEENTFINYMNVSAAAKNDLSDTDEVKKAIWGKEEGYNKKLINIKMLFSYIDHPAANIKGFAEGIRFVENSSPDDLGVSDRLSQVLKTIYNQIITVSIAEIKRVEPRYNYYSILLLVPNIYSQKNIDELLFELNKLNLKSGPRYDFRVISESDAAFIGADNTPTTRGNRTSLLGNIIRNIRDSKQKDMFLIIDAGKGTTDYSVIYYNKDNGANSSITPIRRGGIVGAGGAIDYVFARVLARQVYSHLGDLTTKEVKITQDVFVENFLQMIQNLSPLYQDRIMLIVELLKKKYRANRNNRLETASAYTCFKKEDCVAIMNQLIEETPDYSGINTNTKAWKEISSWKWNNEMIIVTEEDVSEVQWVCDAIAKSVVDDVVSNIDEIMMKRIDYVVLTGRSFLFKPLMSAFKAALHNKPFHKCDGVNYSGRFRPLINSIKILWYNNLMKRGREEAGDKIDELKNLKLTLFNSGNLMKTISVYFTNHDLGVNCNSDLCWTDPLRMLVKGDSSFEISQFWEGFEVNDENDDNRHYYVGDGSYEDQKSFIPEIGIPLLDLEEDGLKVELINMTLFPIAYRKIDFYGLTVNNPKDEKQELPPVQ